MGFIATTSTTQNQMCEYIAQRIVEGREFCHINHKMVYLPSPQRSGTYTQQQTYALLKAREIVDNFKTQKA
tara:strand:- start:6 stop:218 length:213 start_codon:yes stop_codon:yes gene_type:complete